MLQSNIIRYKKRNLFITDEEVYWFWQYSKKYSKLHTAIGFAIWRGFRAGEVGAVNIDDFRESSDLSRMVAILEKSHILDSFPLIKDFSVELKYYIQHNLHLMTDGFLFPAPSSRKAPHWTTHTMDVLLGRLRSEIGLDHPQVLDKTVELSHKYQILKIIDNGNHTPEMIKRFYHGQIATLRKVLDRLCAQDFIDMDCELTVKGRMYISSPKYITRYRIGWHSFRRWFETHIWVKYRDLMCSKDMMRYSKVETVTTYVNPYELWCKEHELMKDVFAAKYKEFENMSHGQERLNRLNNYI